MIWVFWLVLHGSLIAIDEFYFHFRRGLSKWEQIGHPIDTTFFLICCGVAFYSQNLQDPLPVFIGFSILSCLMITKDEWVHQKVCSPAEIWLHSLLFILHPITLYATWQLQGTLYLKIQIGVVIFFLLFQIFFWNSQWLKKNFPHLCELVE